LSKTDEGIQGKKMSDFTSNFWAMWVSGITVVSILACLLLLWFSGKAKAMTAERQHHRACLGW
jgi:hypothetical protein